MSSGLRWGFGEARHALWEGNRLVFDSKRDMGLSKDDADRIETMLNEHATLRARVAELEAENERLRHRPESDETCAIVEQSNREQAAAIERLRGALDPFATAGEGIERLHPDAVKAWRENTVPNGRPGIPDGEWIFHRLEHSEVTPLLLIRHLLEAFDVAVEFGPVPVARCHRRFRPNNEQCILRVGHEGGCQTTFSVRDDDEVAVGRAARRALEGGENGE